MDVAFPDHPLKANGISYLGRGKGAKEGTPIGLYCTHRHKENKMMSFGVKNVCEFPPGTKLFVFLSIPGVHSKIESCAKHKDMYSDSPEFMTLYHRDSIVEERCEMGGRYGFLVPLEMDAGGDSLRYGLVKL